MPRLERMSPIWLLAGALASLGVVSGLVWSLIAASSAAHTQAETGRQYRWDGLILPAAAEAEQAGLTAIGLARRLLDSGLFGDAEKALARIDETVGHTEVAGGSAGESEAGIPPFPVILAAAYLDARPFVYVRGEDGVVRGWPEDSHTESGWHILEISLSSVRARYGDEPERSFPVFAQILPETAEQK